MRFGGCITALITPFKDIRVDWKAFKRHIEWQIKSGVNGLVPCGTTGESACLSHLEHDRVVAVTIEVTAGRVPVIAGTGSNCTKEAIRLTKSAEKAGADAALLITPYYNRPPQSGLYEHYKAIRESTSLPLLPYNVPKRTGVDLSPETVAKIFALDGFVAIKEASGNLMRVNDLIKLGIPVLSGDDDLAWPAMKICAKGVISVVSNFAPKLISGMCQKALGPRFDFDGAENDHEFIRRLSKIAFSTTSPIPTKAILFCIGRCANELRLPLTSLSFIGAKELTYQVMEILGPEWDE